MTYTLYSCLSLLLLLLLTLLFKTAAATQVLKHLMYLTHHTAYMQGKAVFTLSTASSHLYLHPPLLSKLLLLLYRLLLLNRGGLKG